MDKMNVPKPCSDPSPTSEPITAPSIFRRFLNLPNIFALAIAVSLIYFLTVKFEFDIGHIWITIQSNNIIWYATAFLVYYLIFPLRAIRWRLLLEDSMGEGSSELAQVSTLKLVELAFLGWVLNTLTIFRMGFVYRCYQIANRIKISLALVAGNLFAERVLDTVVTYGLLGLAALGLLSSHWNPFITYTLLGGLVTSLAVGGVPLAMILTGKSPVRFLPDRFKDGYDDFRDGTLKSFRRWPRLVVFSLAIWACEAARLAFVIQSLDLDVGLSMVLFVTLGASLITNFPLTPGGLGLVEAAMTGVLATTLTAEQALSVALLDRSINYLSVLLFGGIVLLARAGYSFQKKVSEN